MFDDKHYVPILLTRMGELEAVGNATGLGEHFTPLFVAAPAPWNFEEDVPEKSEEEHLARLPDRLFAAVGDNRAFLDFAYVDPSAVASSGEPLLVERFLAAETAGCTLVPVTGPSRAVEERLAVGRVIRETGRGTCVRLSVDDVIDQDAPATLQSLLAELRVTPHETDLVVDLGSMNDDNMAMNRLNALTVMEHIHDAQAWRSLTLAGASFPATLSSLPNNALSTLPRVEWDVWRHTDSAGVGRRPTYSDYGIAHPDPAGDVNPRFMRMTANLRYTDDESFLVAKGRNTRDFGFDQIRQVARLIVESGRYAGPTFSWGDAWIQDCADGNGTTGNAMTWRKVGTSHHLAKVIYQIASLS